MGWVSPEGLEVPDELLDFTDEIQSILYRLQEEAETEDFDDVLEAFRRRVDDLPLKSFGLKRVVAGVSSHRPVDIGFFEFIDHGSVWAFWTDIDHISFDLAKRDVSIAPPAVPLALKPDLTRAITKALADCASADEATDAALATLATFAETYALSGLAAAARDTSIEDALFEHFEGWYFGPSKLPPERLDANRRQRLERLFILFDSFGVQWPQSVPEQTLRVLASEPSKRYSVRTRFELGDRVEHPKFGKGIVVEVVDAQVAIQFVDQVRRLAHDRG